MYYYCYCWQSFTVKILNSYVGLARSAIISRF